MDPSSPTKRRVLGALDPNASSSPRQTPQLLKQPITTTSKSDENRQPLLSVAVASKPTPLTPSKAEPTKDKEDEGSAGRKRSSQTMAPETEKQDEPVKKRACLSAGDDSETEEADELSAAIAASPDTSSVFDNSAIDTSQATAITEPDENNANHNAAGNLYAAAAAAVAATNPAPPAPVRRTALTREEARQKAEILRLRLGLANYKVRTGQTDVPLERLQIRPLPHVSGAGLQRRDLPYELLPESHRPRQGVDARRVLPSGLSLASLGQAALAAGASLAKQKEEQAKSGPLEPMKQNEDVKKDEDDQRRKRDWSNDGGQQQRKYKEGEEEGELPRLQVAPPSPPGEGLHVRTREDGTAYLGRGVADVDIVVAGWRLAKIVGDRIAKMMEEEVRVKIEDQD
ncbi:hypothetical protein B0H66DRAFT_536691 [Apodospora peruviana]|uniref:Uncharacterized protein n=1 Tax=Apodospora peruviana TaxID=516989 RepID=A0AAE0HVQ3_9PEZI|nr:hypothetical protein B0H66DRAFT_536691 [Apodospora peruviana]